MVQDCIRDVSVQRADSSEWNAFSPNIRLAASLQGFVATLKNPHSSPKIEELYRQISKFMLLRYGISENIRAVCIYFLVVNILQPTKFSLSLILGANSISERLVGQLPLTHKFYGARLLAKTEFCNLFNSPTKVSGHLRDFCAVLCYDHGN